MLPEKYHFLIDINPVAYIVEGYRSALLYQKSIVDDTSAAALFLVVAATVFMAGAVVFRRLKYEFADAV